MRSRHLLHTTCASLVLALAAACRDDDPSPVPPIPPPPEIPPTPGPQQGTSTQPAPSQGSVDVATAPGPTKSQQGDELFAAYCVTCHGTAGAGDGPLARTLDPKPRNFRAGEFKFDTDGDGQAGTEKDLANVIQNGAARYGGSPLMTGFPTLSAPQVQELASHVRGLSGSSSGD